jgi:hypothetical protein
MNSEFENQLQRRPMREIPPHWRSRIIACAQPAHPWWRAWHHPWPRAWATLGAAWVAIFAFYLTTPDDPRPAAGSYAQTPQSFAVLQRESLMMAQLLSSGDIDTPPAAVPPPKPRSDKARPQRIG